MVAVAAVLFPAVAGLHASSAGPPQGQHTSACAHTFGSSCPVSAVRPWSPAPQGSASRRGPATRTCSTRFLCFLSVLFLQV